MRTRHRQTAMLDAAMAYAALGWPVAPATRWLIDAHCATTDQSEIAAWWKTHPDAGIMLVTGGPVDALDVPAPVGHAALARLRSAGLPAGPVATVQDRCYFLVAGGQRDRFVTHHERLGAPQMDFGYHGDNDGILLPPSGRAGDTVRWELDPAESILARGGPLPTGAELHGTIAYVALQEALPA